MPSDNILHAGEQEGFRHYVIELKGEEEYFVEGYISTYDLDKVKDVVTKDGMLDIYKQADTLKADLEHEAYKPDGEGYGVLGSRDALIPVAKVVDKRLDEVGVWVKAKLNPHVEGFKKLWGSIKGGFIDAFSIAFIEPSSTDYSMRGDGARLLNNINLLNVALTGNPVNPHARLTNVVAKSMDKTFEEPKMEEEKKEEPKTEEVTEVKTEADVEAPVEAPVAEAVEEVAEPSAELKSVMDRLEAIENRLTTEKVEVKAEKRVDYKSVIEKLEAIEKKLSEPALKGEIVAKAEKQDINDVSFLHFVK